MKNRDGARERVDGESPSDLPHRGDEMGALWATEEQLEAEPLEKREWLVGNACGVVGE